MPKRIVIISTLLISIVLLTTLVILGVREHFGRTSAGIRFEAGRVIDYVVVGVSEQFKSSQSTIIVRSPENKLVALNAASPHLGCIVNWLPAQQQFQDPCNGSLFDISGINRTGPVGRPLERYRIFVRDGMVVVDTAVKFRYELNEWSQPDSYVDLDRPTSQGGI